MGVHIRVKILGLSGIRAGDHELELREGTLAEAKKYLVQMHQDVALDKAFVGFVNGKAVARDWNDVTLSDGDAVMLVAPISGG